MEDNHRANDIDFYKLYSFQNKKIQEKQFNAERTNFLN